MKKTSILALVLVMLAACGPSPADIQATVSAAMAQTQAAMPTATVLPTQTLFPVESLRPEIEPLLFQDKDFPANWMGGSFSTRLPTGSPYDQLPKPDLTVIQPIINKSYGEEGHALALIYRDAKNLDEAYGLVFDGKAVDGLAEKGKVKSDPKGDWHYVAFIRCDSLVFIKSFGPLEEEVVDYAMRLDGRLSAIVCR